MDIFRISSGSMTIILFSLVSLCNHLIPISRLRWNKRSMINDQSICRSDSSCTFHSNLLIHSSRNSLSLQFLCWEDCLDSPRFDSSLPLENGRRFPIFSSVFDDYFTADLSIFQVGFQTHRDRERFVLEVEKYFRAAKVDRSISMEDAVSILYIQVSFDKQLDIYTISLEGVSCSLGVFPVSIKNEDFLQFVSKPETVKLSADIRRKVRMNYVVDIIEWM